MTETKTLPDIDDMLKAGMPLPDCFRLWGEMMRQQERGADYWWQQIGRPVHPEPVTLQ